jgi:hypothetical protein
MSNNNNSQSMTVYTGTFVTQRGNQRTMNFVRPSEAPIGVFPSVNQERNLQEGYETVYDIDRQAYRTFNSNTQVGDVVSSTQEVSVNLF